ncbi:hypothetical protein UK30_10310 [Salmonella enterica]|nr:hypothetical protein [Salmonella enterica]
MKPTKDKIRNKIATNGFTRRELLSLRRNYKDTKKTFHPNLTKDITLTDIIYETADKSISLFFPAISLFALILGIVLEKGAAYLFMSVVFLLLTFINIYLQAKDNDINITTQFKLIKLGIRILFDKK